MKTMDEFKAMDFLKQAGIPVVETVLAETLESGIAAARKIGYPVVLKLSAEKLAHKTEIGGVELNIRGPEELTAAWQRLMSRAASVGLTSEEGLRGILVQKMNTAGTEFIIGGLRDESFGPVVLVGLGGIYTEVFKDTAFRLAPVPLDEAQRMIDELKAAVLFDGFRGQNPLNRHVLAETVVRISRTLADNEAVSELDINPFIITGDGGCALDALITLNT